MDRPFVRRRTALRLLLFAAGAPLLLPPLLPLAAAEQGRWRHCHKCGSLWFGGTAGDDGVCPAGGTHSASGSGDYYLLVRDEGEPLAANPALEGGWRWCRRCAGLWQPGAGRTLPCPARGAHESEGSGDYWLYRVPKEENAPANTQFWRACVRCGGLTFFEGASGGVCAAGGAHAASAKRPPYRIALGGGSAFQG